MTIRPPTPTAPIDVKGLVALVDRLSALTLDATRLAVEIQAKLPIVVAVEAAAEAAIAAAEAAATRAAEAALDPDDTGPVFVRHAAKTPDELERYFPQGCGEIWYVVLIGREPGMYHTADEANDLCNGVPHQRKEKKKSRREALAWYREAYNADGVQKLVEM